MILFMANRWVGTGFNALAALARKSDFLDGTFTCNITLSSVLGKSEAMTSPGW